MKHIRIELGLAGAIAIAFLACAGDPTHDNAVSALGDDPTGMPNGPTHRAGQPCLTCHGSSGPGNPQFSIGGTVYKVKGQTDPLTDGTVHLTDSTGATFDVPTNEVGNFFVTTAEWQPAAPINVTVTGEGAEADMTSHIGRSGSCSDCHTSTAGPRSPGPVYLALDPADLGGGGGGGTDGGP